MKCRICESNELIEMINLGSQPIAHRLLSSPQDKENKYPFAVHFCKNCGLMQICRPINPKELYLDYNYCFSSWKEEPHAHDEIDTIFAHARGESVFEIGCNDGKFLELLRSKGVPTPIGLEPNPFAGKLAQDKGFTVYLEMLNESLCHKITEKFGKFEVIVIREALEHLTDIKTFFKCINILLRNDGFLFLDTPDAETGLSMGDCSVLWEEHPNYFTESVLKNTLWRFGFEPISVNRYNFSGGVMGVLARRAPEVITNSMDTTLEEKVIDFSRKVNRYREALKMILDIYKGKNFEIVLYGAGCRACTLVNILGLAQYIDFAVDDQQQRQNKYMPASKLPIRAPQTISEISMPVICLLAVNQENENVVKAKVENLSLSRINFVSLCSPNNIWNELENLKHNFSYV